MFFVEQELNLFHSSVILQIERRSIYGFSAGQEVLTGEGSGHTHHIELMANS